jgi:hypothetical protein
MVSAPTYGLRQRHLIVDKYWGLAMGAYLGMKKRKIVPIPEVVHVDFCS